MEKKLLSIGETAEILGVSIDTLRRWENEGIIKSFRPSPTSKRYFQRVDVDRFPGKDEQPYAGDLANLSKSWAQSLSAAVPPSSFYCQTSDVFNARLQRLELELARIPELQNIFPLVVAVIGEIGNNSYNHNIGNWPDIQGAFFGYDIQRRQAVLADRGRGVYATLRRALPNLKDDQEALRVAFTQYISGRAPEARGNGLKFVKDVIVANPLRLQFYTGDAALELRQNLSELNITKAEPSFHGCIALLNY